MARRPNPELSDKHLELLDFILRYVEEHCFQPSKNEMAEHFGVTRNAITSRLEEMESRGALTIPRGGAQRALRINFIRCQIIWTGELAAPDGDGAD